MRVSGGKGDFKDWHSDRGDAIASIDWSDDSLELTKDPDDGKRVLEGGLSVLCVLIHPVPENDRQSGRGGGGAERERERACQLIVGRRARLPTPLKDKSPATATTLPLLDLLLRFRFAPEPALRLVLGANDEARAPQLSPLAARNSAGRVGTSASASQSGWGE